jgi:hypothetical protein
MHRSIKGYRFSNAATEISEKLKMAYKNKMYYITVTQELLGRRSRRVCVHMKGSSNKISHNL